MKLGTEMPIDPGQVNVYFFPENFKSPRPQNPLISNQWNFDIPVSEKGASHYRFSKVLSLNLWSIRLKSYWLTENQ